LVQTSNKKKSNNGSFKICGEKRGLFVKVIALHGLKGKFST
jgi:hypothetical protein